MKKIIIVILVLFMVIAINANAQGAWSSSRVYMYPGEVQTECSLPFVETRYDAVNGYYLQRYQNCRTTIWSRNHGYAQMYFWNAPYRRWEFIWKEGYYWTFYWENRKILVY
jgi:hypothetical protein